MPRNYKRKTDRGCWGKEAMVQALAELKQATSPCSLNDVAKKYGIPQPTLFRYAKQEKEGKSLPLSCGRYTATFTREQENQLVSYIIEADKRAFGLTAVHLRKLAFVFAEESKINHRFNKDSKMAGKDWLQSFLKKNKFSLRKPESTSLGRLMGFNKVNVAKFFKTWRDIKTSKGFMNPESIYNCDETSLSTVPTKLPNVISPTGNRRVSRVVSAERGKTTTLVCAMNAAGSFVPPFLIFARKRNRPEFLNDCPPGTKMAVCDKGWMTAEVFLLYLQHFASHAKPSAQYPIILFMDNHASHVTLEAVNYARDNFITLMGFPPHCSHRLQPLDVSFYGPLKTYYSQACDTWMVNHPGQVIGEKDVGGLLHQAYFKAATVGNAVNGFRATGIMPFNPDVFTDGDFAAAETTEQAEPEEYNATVPDRLVATVPDRQVATVADVDGRVLETREDGVLMPKMPKATIVRKRKRAQPPSYHISGTPVKNFLEEKVASKKEKEEKKLKRQQQQKSKKVAAKKKLFVNDNEYDSESSNSLIAVELLSEEEPDDDMEDEELSLPADWDRATLREGDFVLVLLTDHGHSTKIYYVARIEEKSEAEFVVSFMRKSSKQEGFFFPNELDISTVAADDIKLKLEAVKQKGTTKRQQSYVTFTVKFHGLNIR